MYSTDVENSTIEPYKIVDSHIQRIFKGKSVLSLQLKKLRRHKSAIDLSNANPAQSRLWSQRGTKVNGSHHGDNPLLRPTGIQIATKSYAALQAMAPTNVKTVHQTSLLHIESNLDRLGECCRLPTTSVLSKKRKNYAPTSFDQQVQFSQGHTLYRNKKNGNTEVHGGGGLELVKPAREPASSRRKPCASLKKLHESEND